MAHGHDKGALSSGPSRQPSRTLSMQSSYSEPSGQEALAAPSNLLKRDRDRDRDRERDRDRAALGMGSEPQLQRDSASQVELAAQAVEAREAEKERLRYTVLLRPASDTAHGLLGRLQGLRHLHDHRVGLRGRRLEEPA
jgi:hypothetical protein